jgi:hypothetical protein
MKAQKHQIPVNTFVIYTTGWYLKMLRFVLVQWAHWQSLVRWLTHSRYLHSFLIVYTVTVQHVSALSDIYYTYYLYLQPRIFVLLRRCLFDGDDEVSAHETTYMWCCIIRWSLPPCAFLLLTIGWTLAFCSVRLGMFKLWNKSSI